jgi:hypothetical protein
MTSSTQHPSLSDYDNALVDPGGCFSREELREAVFYENPRNPTFPTFIWASGSFAAVTKAIIDGKDWAVRLLTRNQPHLADRYDALGRRPESLNRYFVETSFLTEEITVAPLTGRFPVVLIEWIEGETLGEFVQGAWANKDLEALETLHKALNRLRLDLAGAGIAHGDLSTSNILVEGSGSTLRLRLVDYDSLWIPHRCEFKCSVGLGGLQHPRRPNPIGASADTAAFGMFTVGLDVLCENPHLVREEHFGGDGFLITVSELLKGEHPIAQTFLQLRRGQLLQEYLMNSIDDHCRVWDEETEGPSLVSAIGDVPSEPQPVDPFPEPIPPPQPEPSSKPPWPPPVVDPHPTGEFKSRGESFGDDLRMGRKRADGGGTGSPARDAPGGRSTQRSRPTGISTPRPRPGQRRPGRPRPEPRIPGDGLCGRCTNPHWPTTLLVDVHVACLETARSNTWRPIAQTGSLDDAPRRHPGSNNCQLCCLNSNEALISVPMHEACLLLARRAVRVAPGAICTTCGKPVRRSYRCGCVEVR